MPLALRDKVQKALVDAFGPEYAAADPLLTAATKPEFGDYQCNAALPLAKQLKRKPREVAESLRASLSVDELCEPVEIAGPGFLNFRLRRDLLSSELRAMVLGGDSCGVPPAPTLQSIVVDYSSPNIAKEMHVGHLRSTIIGDALARVLELRGHKLLRLNHVGDWGTQFGMLITHMREEAPEALAVSSDAAPLDISDLVELYKAAKARFDADPAFQTASRAEVVKLQSGDAASTKAWRALCEQSEAAFSQVYATLGVDERLVTRGESFYNARLAGVVDALDKAGLVEVSGGARCVFLDGYTNRDGERLPMIIQKSDGGFMYSTTDLAAIEQRAAEEGADRVLYVTDAGQALHFEQVFQVARKGKLVADDVSLEHVPFGLVQGEDGKKFKTRSGETVKLSALLDEAVSRARADIEARLEAEGRAEADGFVDTVARAVGIGAVKYADLSMNRQSNYRFSFQKMLALNGNTAPYMMYAYARIRGIQRKAAAGTEEALSVDGSGAPPAISLDEEAELNLARHLLRLAPTVAEVERDLLPSKLCEYIFELSSRFNQFYEACPVLSAEPELRRSRLALCELTATALRLNLRLLGIEPLEKI
jgi:arginyl-tRNA synthetase